MQFVYSAASLLMIFYGSHFACYSRITSGCCFVIDRKCPYSSGQRHKNDKRIYKLKVRFKCLKKMKDKKLKLKFEFRFLIQKENGKQKWKIEFCFSLKQENENKSSNSVFRCSRKAVSTKVHAFFSPSHRFFTILGW